MPAEPTLLERLGPSPAPDQIKLTVTTASRRPAAQGSGPGACRRPCAAPRRPAGRRHHHPKRQRKRTMRNDTDYDWTDDATIATLRRLWSEGHSTAEIGRRMGISKNAVVGKAHRLDLPGRRSPIKPRDPSAPKPKRKPRSRQTPRITLPRLQCLQAQCSAVPAASSIPRQVRAAPDPADEHAPTLACAATIRMVAVLPHSSMFPDKSSFASTSCSRCLV